MGEENVDVDLSQFPPWIDKKAFWDDVAQIVAKYEITVGMFYDGLGVDLVASDAGPPYDDPRTNAINQIAELARIIRAENNGPE